MLAAARAIAPVLRPGNLVLLESTSPVGTTEQVAQVIAEASGLSSEQLHIAYCPERVLPGRILQELISNDRVIGGLTPAAAAAGQAFYASFCQGELLPTTARTAELVKLTENSFRDVNIAFANELSLVCDHLDINVRELIRLANHHPRVNVLQPGCGVGGHCIAVDPWFIAAAAPTAPPDPVRTPCQRWQEPLGDRAGAGPCRCPGRSAWPPGPHRLPRHGFQAGCG